MARGLKLSNNTEEVFNIPHQSILTSPMHPKYSRSVHWDTEGPVRIQIPCPAPHRKPLAEACSNSALWQSTWLSQHDTLLFFYSLQFIHQIFSNFRNKRRRCTTDNSLIAALMCPQYTICPVQRTEWKALCNRYLKPIVQCTQNNHITNAELSSPVH